MNESLKELVTQLTNEQLFAVWFLIGAALVFWMQAGFAMVEAGFTRAKNTGNIIMKNLMDFCIGTVTFILIGFGLLMGEDLIGLIGKPGFDLFSSYANFNFSSFVFNLVFCATTATIVSGAMAERTKFLSYCVYSGIISAVIYPIEAHWIWGGGWLSQLGFHDFASANLKRKRTEPSRSEHSPVITLHWVHLAYSSSGSAGTALTARLRHLLNSLDLSF